ncbi:MAG TPA: hypothetical protein VKE49_06185 [Myxococcaceae bacterium]|nr:hypothetical protein [Myxococcaceae bacterium]
MPPSPPWRFSASSTVRGIYVLRYLLFSGGLAIAGALVERSALGVDRPLAGFAIGFAAGLVIFRGQLRALWWPTVAASRESVYLIRRNRATIIPWDSIAGVLEDSGFVALQLRSPLALPDGSPVERVRLEARKMGTSHRALLDAMQLYAQGRASRIDLPDDAQVRQLLAMSR